MRQTGDDALTSAPTTKVNHQTVSSQTTWSAPPAARGRPFEPAWISPITFLGIQRLAIGMSHHPTAQPGGCPVASPWDGMVPVVAGESGESVRSIQNVVWLTSDPGSRRRTMRRSN